MKSDKLRQQFDEAVRDYEAAEPHHGARTNAFITLLTIERALRDLGDDAEVRDAADEGERRQG